MYTLTFEQLLEDLYKAYIDARRGKRNKSYQKRFERDFCANLHILAQDLYQRVYEPRPSMCFIISDPKKREVFAANFRDRIVHHLYFNYVHEMFERTFIADSYSCIKGRGTHYGIKRLRDHIRSESRAFTRPCYVLKIDIRGYFMHIDRNKLYEIACKRLTGMATHKIKRGEPDRWEDKVDIDFCKYLTEKISLLNPLDNCFSIGDESEWKDLPHDKSLFYSQPGVGLPIGNLTSQLYSNVYLGVFDDYMKRDMKCRHYGRYVDDAYVVSTDRTFLMQLIPKAETFLKTELGLELHKKKTKVLDVYSGVEFLGAFIRPHTIYISKGTLNRMRKHIKRTRDDALRTGDYTHLSASFASFRGVLSHFDAYNIGTDIGLY